MEGTWLLVVYWIGGVKFLKGGSINGKILVGKKWND